MPDPENPVPDTEPVLSGRTREILSVGELTRRIKHTLETGFGSVWLTGEVSNLRIPASGHVYLTLKDAEAQIRTVIWGATARYMRELPGEGDQVLCRARLTVYEPRGDYQLIIDYLEPAGTGMLYRRIEEAKARLQAAGLFDAERKRPLPPFPRRVAVVTSSTGAAVRDVLSVLGRRAPGVPVLIVPAPVQGNEAPTKLIQALERAAAAPEVDVVLLVRGGGSLEDLMAFNDEALVRAVAAIPVPVVSGVGHETDVTLTDFAADRRAPTPSAAAEMVSAAWVELEGRLLHLQGRMTQMVRTLLRVERLRLEKGAHRLIDPRERVRHLIQRVDDLTLHLSRQAAHHLHVFRNRSEALAARLHAAGPGHRILRLEERATALAARLHWVTRDRVGQSRNRLGLVGAQMKELSPLAVLSRGFAVTYRDGQVLRRAGDATPGDRVRIRLHQGELGCRVEQVHPGNRQDA